ncbi:hypothetical protein [Intestinibacter sp.]|nr:hypothetical protein [Intestinibacter sp.]MDY2735191.1 hypothetical protein [Intestinibacter sp.]
MPSIVEILKDLSVQNAQFLYEELGIVFFVNDGELVGIAKEA